MTTPTAKTPTPEAAITNWCAKHGFAVTEVKPTGDGALNQHWLVQVEGQYAPLVCRTRGQGHWLDHGFFAEAKAMYFAAKAGLPVPQVLKADRQALLMRFVEGTADRESVLAAAAGSENLRGKLIQNLRNLAENTAVSFGEGPGAEAWLRKIIGDYCLTQTPWFQRTRQSARAQAVLDRALDTGFDSLCLSHGDYRTGNLLISGDHLTALVDWEFAAIRPVEADIGWMLSSTWRYSRPDLHASGLMSREALLTGLSQKETPRLRAWEALALIRWMVIGRLQDDRQGLEPGSNANEDALLSEAEALLAV